MHLEQGQVWKKGGEYLRIVTWERMAIEYKAMTDLEAGEGPVQRVTKKEFCRIIKGAALHLPEAPSPDRTPCLNATPSPPDDPEDEKKPPAPSTR